MKRTFFAALGVLAVAACSQNRPAEEPVTAPYSAASDTELEPASGYRESDASSGDAGVRTDSEARAEDTAAPGAAAESRAAAPDNTEKNQRDQSDGAVTPMDQGNNQGDLTITQKIRQAVMADDALSFTAKNAKIITANGKVTLRGPVNSAEERASIEAAARKVAGVRNVDNQLEVKK